MATLDVVKKVLEALTPFFPGIAHSHVIRFRDPSGFFIGLATNPCNHITRCNLTTTPKSHYKPTPQQKLLTKGWSFRQAFLSSAKRALAMPDIA